MSTRALIICVSVSNGNTATVARAIGSALGAEIREPEEVDPRSLDEYDVVGFGSGIYGASHHERLRKYIAGLPEVTGKAAFVFSTSGVGRSQSLPWQPSLESMLKAKGYEVVGSFACRGLDTVGPLGLLGGLNKGHPDAADLTHAFEFGRRVADRVPARGPCPVIEGRAEPQVSRLLRARTRVLHVGRPICPDSSDMRDQRPDVRDSGPSTG